MANTKLIEEYIRCRGYKLQFVAQMLGISSSALRQKLLGETQFKLDEAEKLSAMLGLSMVERDACFFEKENWLELHAGRPMGERRVRNDERTADPYQTGPAPVRYAAMGARSGK